MKKLVVTVIAMGMAIASQAAQVTWSANTIAQSGDSTSYYAMFLDVTGMTSATADSVAASIIDGTFTGKTVYEGAATYNATKNQVAVMFSKKETLVSYANEQTINYMTIVFDASTAAAAQNYMVTSGDSPATGQFSAAGLLAVAQGSQASKMWTAVGGGGSDIPEPTSGLLLVLGGAMLALRRRR